MYFESLQMYDLSAWIILNIVTWSITNNKLRSTFYFKQSFYLLSDYEM